MKPTEKKKPETKKPVSLKPPKPELKKPVSLNPAEPEAEKPEEFDDDYDYYSAESSEASSESKKIKLSSDQKKIKDDTFLAERPR